jgi:hypothetical protein
LRDNETKDRRCSNRAFGEALGLGADFLGRIPAEIDSISVEEFNAYLRAYLDMDRASLVIVGPNDVIDGSAPGRAGKSIDSRDQPLPSANRSSNPEAAFYPGLYFKIL